VRLLQRLLLVILLLFVFLIGLDRVLAGLWGLGPHPVLAHTPGLRFWLSAGAGLRARVFWLGLTLMPILYLLISLARLRRPGAFLVESSNGENLHLDPAALTKFARVQVENHPAVVAQKVAVRQSGGNSISVTARVTVRPIQSLPSIRAALERLIRDGFSQVMGIEKIDEVKIVIGLDERSIGERPGLDSAPEPRPEPPLRSEYLPPASPAPGETAASAIAFEPAPEAGSAAFDPEDAPAADGDEAAPKDSPDDETVPPARNDNEFKF
jgi:hypothetical protein